MRSGRGRSDLAGLSLLSVLEEHAVEHGEDDLLLGPRGAGSRARAGAGAWVRAFPMSCWRALATQRSTLVRTSKRSASLRTRAMGAADLVARARPLGEAEARGDGLLREAGVLALLREATADMLRLPRTAAETILPVRLSGATMSDPSTTTLSSKGQVVIPEEIRERLGLKAGAQFVVLGDKDVVIFKILQPPAKRDFTALVQQARQAAKQTGMRRADIATAVSKTRRARRAK